MLSGGASLTEIEAVVIIWIGVANKLTPALDAAQRSNIPRCTQAVASTVGRDRGGGQSQLIGGVAVVQQTRLHLHIVGVACQNSVKRLRLLTFFVGGGDRVTGLIQQNHVRVGEQPIELKLELADLPQLKPVVVAIVEAADVILEGLGSG